jgi:hypothetical protein
MIRTVACAMFCLSASLAMLAADSTNNVSGCWLLTADVYGSLHYLRLQLEQKVVLNIGNQRPKGIAAEK